MKYLFLALIKFYQFIISPLFGSNCRFQPTCSVYAFDAILTYGTIKGIKLSIKRLAKCHPWGSSGYDPIPNNKKLK